MKAAQLEPTAPLPLAPTSPTGALVTLVCVHWPQAGIADLDARLRAVVDRYVPLVELVFAAEPPAQAVSAGAAGDPPRPRLLVMRRGQLIAEAVGAQLPAREVEHLVRCAIEWPTVALASAGSR